MSFYKGFFKAIIIASVLWWDIKHLSYNGCCSGQETAFYSCFPWPCWLKRLSVTCLQSRHAAHWPYLRQQVRLSAMCAIFQTQRGRSPHVPKPRGPSWVSPWCHHLCVQPHRTVCPISFLLFWATPPPPVPAQPHWSCSVLIPVVPACSFPAVVRTWVVCWYLLCLSLPGSPWVMMAQSRIRKRTFGLRRWRTSRRAASLGSSVNLR